MNHVAHFTIWVAVALFAFTGCAGPGADVQSSTATDGAIQLPPGVTGVEIDPVQAARLYKNYAP